MLYCLGLIKDSLVAGKPKSQNKPAQTKFGRNLARLRVVSGLTQERLAEAIDISLRYEQSIEAGQYFPSLQALLRLRKALSCNWEELFKGL